MKNSFRLKWLGPIALVIVELFLIINTFGIDWPMLRTRMIDEAKENVRNELNRAQAQINILYQARQGDRIIDEIAQLASNRDDDTVVLLDEFGTVIASNNPNYREYLPKTLFTPSQWHLIYQSITQVKLKISEYTDDKIVAAIPITFEVKEGSLNPVRLGSLVVMNDYGERYNETFWMLLWRLGIQATVLLVLGALWWWLFERLAGRPIRKLQDSALRIASGDLSGRFDSGGSVEMVQLSHTLNTMAETIEVSAHTNRALLDAQPNIVVFTDGKILVDVNQAFLNFFSQYNSIEDFLKEHRCICDFFENMEKPNFLVAEQNGQNWIELLQANPNTQYKVMMRRFGVETIFAVNFAAVEVGERWRNIATFTDITADERIQDDLNHALEQLREKENMMIMQSRMAAMGEMISMIAHQWRQPITVIAMEANTIILDTMMGSLDSDEVSIMGHKILEMTQQLSRTIDDFRNFFKPDKEKENTLLSDIIDDALSLVNKSLEHNAIVLHREEAQLSVKVFRREVMQVLVNILNNAKEALVEHSSSNREIMIHSFSKEGEVMLQICNNGGRISSDIIGNIFDPYFTTKEKSNGTGLGLYMSKMIIEHHLHGTLRVDNSNDGCCFTITLPKESK